MLANTGFSLRRPTLALAPTAEAIAAPSAFSVPLCGASAPKDFSGAPATSTDISAAPHTSPAAGNSLSADQPAATSLRSCVTTTTPPPALGGYSTAWGHPPGVPQHRTGAASAASNERRNMSLKARSVTSLSYYGFKRLQSSARRFQRRFHRFNLHRLASNCTTKHPVERVSVAAWPSWITPARATAAMAAGRGTIVTANDAKLGCDTIAAHGTAIVRHTVGPGRYRSPRPRRPRHRMRVDDVAGKNLSTSQLNLSRFCP